MRSLTSKTNNNKPVLCALPLSDLLSQRGVFVVLGLSYVNWGCLHCLGAQLRKLRLLEPSGGVAMRIEATGVVWGVGYTIRGCLCCLGTQLHETRLFASF